jgi:hypothetical protein
VKLTLPFVQVARVLKKRKEVRLNVDTIHSRSVEMERSMSTTALFAKVLTRYRLYLRPLRTVRKKTTSANSARHSEWYSGTLILCGSVWHCVRDSVSQTQSLRASEAPATSGFPFALYRWHHTSPVAPQTLYANHVLSVLQSPFVLNQQIGVHQYRLTPTCRIIQFPSESFELLD